MSIDEILAQAARSGLFSPRTLRGCVRSEIHFLEHKYRLTLPSGYRRFLELAGHDSGLLFRWDHFAVSYAHVARLTEDERSRLREDGYPPLAADAFLICGRLSEQFEVIRTGQGDASPVRYYAESEPSPRIEYPSFAAWLTSNLEGALAAQASGYFARHPHGTEP